MSSYSLTLLLIIALTSLSYALCSQHLIDTQASDVYDAEVRQSNTISYFTLAFAPHGMLTRVIAIADSRSSRFSCFHMVRRGCQAL